MIFRSRATLPAVVLLTITTVPVRGFGPACGTPSATLITSGIQGASGSSVGPGGALYVTEGQTGSILKVDPQTGAFTTWATGLPKAVLPIGGATDLAFIGGTAYVLVTLVGTDVGGSSIDGIYRMDTPTHFTPIADIGTWSAQHPPATDYFLPMGVQYTIETHRGGFLVTDGHHNRVLSITKDGRITEMKAFDNIVPTGLAVSGDTIFMAEAGPVPHLPQTGRVVAFAPNFPGSSIIAAGARLLVDVEFGRGRELYALSQGIWGGGDPGSPAMPGTGSLVQVNADGTFTTVVSGLNLPTSLEFIGDAGFAITLAGEIWRLDGAFCPPNGVPR